MRSSTRTTKLWVSACVLAATAALASCADAEVATPASIPQAAATVPNTSTPTFVQTLTESTSTPLPVATQTPTWIPTPTVMPSATPTPFVGTVSATLDERVWEKVAFYANEWSPRQSATDQELVASMYFADLFEDLGYDVDVIPFEVTNGLPIAEMREVVSADDAPLLFDTFAGPSPFVRGIPVEPLAQREGEGELVYVGHGSRDEIKSLELEGRVALAEYGTISVEAKYRNVLDAGAVALVIFDNRNSRRLRWEEISVTPEIPIFNVRRPHGLKLIEKMESGRKVVINAAVENLGSGPSRNVIAELNNDVEGDDVVVVGAHYDTTPSSSGANDNGTGLAVVSILAQEWADDDLPFDLRIILFGSEETGLHGSSVYVDGLQPEDISRIDAMINIDSVGRGILAVEDTGAIAEMAMGVAAELDIELLVENIGYAASDHAAFNEAGVDVMFIYANDLSYINSPRDILERVDPEPVSDAVAIVGGVIQELIEEAR